MAYYGPDTLMDVVLIVNGVESSAPIKEFNSAEVGADFTDDKTGPFGRQSAGKPSLGDMTVTLGGEDSALTGFFGSLIQFTLIYSVRNPGGTGRQFEITGQAYMVGDENGTNGGDFGSKITFKGWESYSMPEKSIEFNYGQGTARNNRGDLLAGVPVR